MGGRNKFGRALGEKSGADGVCWSVDRQSETSKEVWLGGRPEEDGEERVKYGCGFESGGCWAWAGLGVGWTVPGGRLRCSQGHNAPEDSGDYEGQ